MNVWDRLHPTPKPKISLASSRFPVWPMRRIGSVSPGCSVVVRIRPCLIVSYSAGWTNAIKCGSGLSMRPAHLHDVKKPKSGAPRRIMTLYRLLPLFQPSPVLLCHGAPGVFDPVPGGPSVARTAISTAF